MEVGNGGFGPGYGLLGIADGAKDDTRRNAIDMYLWYRERDSEDPAWKWPAKLLPICHLGSGMYVCTDCSTQEGAIVWYEPNPREIGEPMDDFLIPVTDSFEEWMWKWVRDEDWVEPAYERSSLRKRSEEKYGVDSEF